MNWRVEPLSGGHERKQFCCGQAPLDTYIQKYARQHARKDFGRTFVAVLPGTKQVLGYYTLSSSSVAFDHAPPPLQKRLPRYPIPCALLGKLAVDQTVSGRGLGSFLLMDALRRVAEIGGEMAIFAVEVYALDRAAKSFYRQYGFQEFQDHPHHLFLPMSTIQRLF